MNNNNSMKSLLKMIDDQKIVIHQLNQEVLNLSKKFSKVQITQTLLLSLLVKYNPKFLDFIESEINELEEAGFYQNNTEKVAQLKKVRQNIRTIASKSKESVAVS